MHKSKKRKKTNIPKTWNQKQVHQYIIFTLENMLHKEHIQ